MASPITQQFPEILVPDVREIVMSVWRHRRLVMLIAGTTFVLGSVFVLFSTNKYTSSAAVMLEGHNLKLTNFEDVTQGAEFDDLTVQTEVKMLGSQKLAMQTIKRAGLEKDASGAAQDEQATLNWFMKGLSISPQGASRVIEISFSSDDPELSAKVVNTHVQAYMDSQIEYKQQHVEQLREWFEARVKDMKEDVTKRSQAVEKYRSKENLAVGKDSRELIYQQISDMASQLPILEVHLTDVDAKLKAIEEAKKTNLPDAINDVVNSPLIQNLKEQESELAVEAQSMRSQYGRNHPKRVSAESQLGQVRNAIQAEVDNIYEALENDRISTVEQVSSLKIRLENLKKEADDLREKSITLNGLILEQEASQKMLDSFLTNYENIQSQVNFARPDAVLVSSAVAPLYPSFPTKKVKIFLVMIFSISLGLAGVLAVEVMRTGIRNFTDIRKLGQKPLGILPFVTSPLQQFANGGESSTRESLKRIYMSSLMNARGKTVLVTSALPREGRTTFTLSMARYLASIGHKVLVIDGDFLKPSLSLLTVGQGQSGLTDVLSGQAQLANVIRRDESGVYVLSGGHQSLYSPDLLLSGKLDDILGELNSAYSYVLIDGGPMLSYAESGILAKKADNVIIVAEWAKTSEKNIASVLSDLKEMSVSVFGIVINKVDIEKYKLISSETDFLLPNLSEAA